MFCNILTLGIHLF